MKSGYVGVLSCIVLVGLLPLNCSLAAPFEEYRPTWTVGQKWRVKILREAPLPLAHASGTEVETSTEARKLQIMCDFLVESIRKLEGELCWSVRIEVVSVNGQDVSGQAYHRCYFLKRDLSLRASERFHASVKKPENTTHLGGGRPVIGVECGYLPMAFPLFAARTGEYRPKKHKQESGPDYYDEKEAYQTCSIKKMPDGNKALKIYLEEKYERNPKDPKPEAVKDGQVEMDRNTRRSATQIWQKGMPWWSETEVKERRNTNNVSIRVTRGRLVRVDGKAVPEESPSS